eukprot:Lankesteria_metandrocarpae@DN8383_c0_g1_i1.p1
MRLHAFVTLFSFLLIRFVICDLTDLSDKVALVTGAGRGIGRQILLDLVSMGIGGAVCVDVTPSACTDTLEEAKKVVSSLPYDHPIRLAGFGADVSNFDSVTSAANEVLASFGKVDILVNNAGITRDNVMWKLSDDDWESVIKTNLSSMFYLCKNFVPAMTKNRWGRVINMASIVGIRGNVGQSNYAASKAGVIGFTKALARELAPFKVTVNALAPGMIDTKMTQDMKPKTLAAVLQRNPFQRLGTMSEVSAGVRYFVTADYTTGSTLGIDGAQIF